MAILSFSVVVVTVLSCFAVFLTDKDLMNLCIYIFIILINVPISFVGLILLELSLARMGAARVYIFHFVIYPHTHRKIRACRV